MASLKTNPAKKDAPGTIGQYLKRAINLSFMSSMFNILTSLYFNDVSYGQRSDEQKQLAILEASEELFRRRDGTG